MIAFLAMSHDIRNILQLARLSANDEYYSELNESFEKIIGHVEKLQSLDLGDTEDSQSIPSMTHVHSDTQKLRADTIVSTLTHEEALMNAPKKSGRSFETPLIISSKKDEAEE